MAFPPCKKNFDVPSEFINLSYTLYFISKSIIIIFKNRKQVKQLDNEVKTIIKDAAKRMVTNLCKKANILELRNIKRGKYFRIVADVYIDGQCLADILIKNGLAKPYDGGKKPQW